VDIAAVTVGSAGFLVLAMSAGAFSAALRTSVLQFLGRISYSLYLVHAIVLLAALSLLYNHIPVWVILPMVWTASLALATLSERYIERPSITLGRMLTRRPDYKPVAVGAAD
jgi:peptidoglycan/LPS O-acetylase OafA/YrhL